MPVDSNITILLVENSTDTRKMEVDLLNSIGFNTILEAEDADVAVEMLQTDQQVGLIISDWNLPNRDGFQLLQWVRSDDKCNGIPFIIATVKDEKKQAKLATEAGVSGLVTKPFSADELRNQIEMVFASNMETSPVSTVNRREPVVGPEGKVRLNVAHIQITDHIILGVVKHLIELGELEPKYFDLDTVCMESWNEVKSALKEGKVDAAFVLAPLAMELFGTGTPIRLILLAHKNGSIFVRKKDSASNDADAFRNKTFYVPHRQSIQHALTHLYFSELGLKPGISGTSGELDVRLEVVPPIKMPEALKNNANSVGFMAAGPIDTEAIAAGTGELQFLSSEVWPNHPCCVVAARDEVVDGHIKAMQEFVDMLVIAGKTVSQRSDMVAEIALPFLDPKGELGLTKAVLKDLFIKKAGITTDDLYPVIGELERLQTYMCRNMGIGSLIDLDQFVDTSFAQQACRVANPKAKAKAGPELGNIVNKVVKARMKEVAGRGMLDKEGKYLICSLEKEEYGLSINSIREIIGMMPITPVPFTPNYLKGVINLRGKVIPVVDLRLVFGLESVNYSDRHCTVVVELKVQGESIQAGVVVDSVSEAVNLTTGDIDPPPAMMTNGLDINYVMGMYKAPNAVVSLLDIEHVVGEVIDKLEAEV